jgi:hypothetical protein
LSSSPRVARLPSPSALPRFLPSSRLPSKARIPHPRILRSLCASFHPRGFLRRRGSPTLESRPRIPHPRIKQRLVPCSPRIKQPRLPSMARFLRRPARSGSLKSYPWIPHPRIKQRRHPSILESSSRGFLRWRSFLRRQAPQRLPSNPARAPPRIPTAHLLWKG